MSFFNTLQQYVTNLNNSVANLNISPRRFSLSGRDSFDSASLDGGSANPPPSQPLSVSPYSSNHQQPSPAPSPLPSRAHPQSLSVESANESPCSSPKSPIRASSRPLAPRSAAHLLQERSKSLKTAPCPPPHSPLSAKKSNARAGSLKEGTACSAVGWASHHHSPLQKRKEIKLLPTFARLDGSRRTAWPQFAITGSGVQEADGSFFESFTALSWKQENRRLQVLREDEVFNPIDCQTARSSGHAPENNMSAKELEQLYIEVLYTIRHKIGAHSAQYPHHYKEDLIRYAQSAFNFGSEQHRRCQAIASEEKPPIVVLNVIVIEAEGLEAKDPNGFSDPYCMLGIHPGSCKVEQQQQLQGEQQPPSDAPVPEPKPNRSEERRGSLISMALGLDQQKKHHFRLSFKRKESSHSNSSYNSGRASISSAGSNCSSGNSREQRDSLHAALPAKFIRATSVKGQTLNPKWNEKFRFDIDDVSSDTLHLDIWDHDDEYSVLDAVSKLNEVRGVKGLGRFFKQIAQSARSGNQDDFLGCVNIPIQDIPSTGVETWYKLEGRSQRSTIQGRIRLKLFLSTREDLGTSEEDNWTEVKQQENLHCVFIDYELSVFKNAPWQWSGDMTQQALTILHQHAIQGDVTVLQSYVVRWIAFARKLPDKSIHFSVLYNILNDLESHFWATEPLSREEEDALGESFKAFIDYSLTLLRRMRLLFNNKAGGLSRLEYLLKCLSFLENSRVFRRCCPFHKEIRGEVVASLRKGVVEWYTFEQDRCIHNEAVTVNHVSGLIVLTNRLYADLMRTLQIYDDMFQKIYSIPYFAIVYRSHIKTIVQDYSCRLEAISACFDSGSEVGVELASPVFELHVALQDLQKFHDQLPAEEFQNHTVALQCHEWFRKPLEYWLIMARSKALHRVRMAVQLDSHTNVEPYLIHSTSAIDTTSCFYQICEFWKQIAWPDSITAFPFVYSIVEMVTACATVYADLIFARVQTTGFFNEETKTSPLSAEIYVPLNDLEHVKCALVAVPQTLQVSAVAAAVDNMPAIETQRSPVLGRSRSSSVASGAHIPSPSYLMIASTSCYESSARLAFQGLLETAREHYETKLLRICGCLAEKMRAELKKNIFHLAWSPDSLPAREAAAPLMECLDQLLLGLEPNLLPAAFHRCVIALWDVLLFELWNQAEMSSGEKFCKFYERLHEALELLVQFLHAEGKGVPLEALQSPTYQRVEEKISLHKTKTDKLIDMYYTGRLEQQQQVQAAMDHTPYGVLSIRAYFHHDSLSVEIISAKDVIPLDPNGLSDPFVIIELLPRRVFTNCTEQQTSVRRRNLNPTFDECFEFPVTVEQCRQETSMLLFTVMDYDVLTANDFAGEALLSLNAIPGVAAPGVAQGFDNTFHGLKQIDLVLMHQLNKHHPILAALECRHWDRTAQEFVRKQKERISS